MSIDNKKRCPVCAEVSTHDCLVSEGVVLSGVEALLEGDDDSVRYVYQGLTPFDAHVAISMYAGLVINVCNRHGLDWREVLRQNRTELHERIVKAQP